MLGFGIIPGIMGRQKIEHTQGHTDKTEEQAQLCLLGALPGATEVTPLVAVTLEVMGSWYTRS